MVVPFFFVGIFTNLLCAQTKFDVFLKYIFFEQICYLHGGILVSFLALVVCDLI